jgi:hypothetical protein
MTDFQKFKDAIKRLKPKQFTKKFWDDVNEAIEKRYSKCKEDDKKRMNIDMDKRFNI